MKILLIIYDVTISYSLYHKTNLQIHAHTHIHMNIPLAAGISA